MLHGDGSYGINAMEIDTAVRHKIPVLVVISNNGGWTADPKQDKPGRNLGYTRYDKMAQDFGAYGEFVEKPHEIRPALERALGVGQAGGRQRHHRLHGSRVRRSASRHIRPNGMGGLEGPPKPLALGDGPASARTCDVTRRAFEYPCAYGPLVGARCRMGRRRAAGR